MVKEFADEEASVFGVRKGFSDYDFSSVVKLFVRVWCPKRIFGLRFFIRFQAVRPCLVSEKDFRITIICLGTLEEGQGSIPGQVGGGLIVGVWAVGFKEPVAGAGVGVEGYGTAGLS